MSAAGSACRAEMAALGVVEMVDENMANAARVHAIESGKGYEGRTMIAFGGGGPLHGYRVAEKLGIDARAGAVRRRRRLSAIGFLRAPVAYEVVRSRYQRFAQLRRRGGERAAGGDGGGGDGGGGRRARFGAPIDGDAASPTCAMSARATRSRCRCRRAR